MRNPKQISPTELPLGFEYEEGHAEEEVTGLAGVPMLVQAFRSLQVGSSVNQNVTGKQPNNGFDEATTRRRMWRAS